MSFYQRSQQQQQQGNGGNYGGGSGNRASNNRGGSNFKNSMQSQLVVANSSDYQCLSTKDGKKLGWFFKQPQPAYKCLHGIPMERPDGVFQVQCSILEDNCGAKIFEGASSVLSLCTPTEVESVTGVERVVLGIVPIIFCLKNANLHISLSSIQGRLMLKCQDSTCPVVESVIDCESCLIAPSKLLETVAKVYAIRDRVSRQQFLFELLEFVRKRTFAELDDKTLPFPLPKIQKMHDLLSRMTGGVNSTPSLSPLKTIKKRKGSSIEGTIAAIVGSSGEARKKKVRKLVGTIATAVADPEPPLKIVIDHHDSMQDEEMSSDGSDTSEC